MMSAEISNLIDSNPMTRESQEKLERLIRLINKGRLRCLMIHMQRKCGWLEGGGSNGFGSSRESGVGTLLVRHDGRKFALANRIEMARLWTEELAGQDYEPVEFAWEDERANPQFVAEVARKLVTEQLPLGSDSVFGNATRVMEAAISRARYRLTDDEIDRFRSLGRDAGTAIGKMAHALTPGISEQDVARRAVDALAKVGATSVGPLVPPNDPSNPYPTPLPTNLLC